MDKKELEEMARVNFCIKESCDDCIKSNRKCAYYQVAEVLYNAGYRKAEEVRKETAREILEVVGEVEDDGVLLKDYMWFSKLCKKYDLEKTNNG